MQLRPVLKVFAILVSLLLAFVAGRSTEQVESDKAALYFAARQHPAFASGDMTRLERQLVLDLKGVEKFVDDPVHAFLWNLTKRGGREESLREAKAYAASVMHPAFP